ncbi:MAG TPA: tail fiber domain-containing protein, partial [Thermoanaerobaculia bacterium]
MISTLSFAAFAKEKTKEPVGTTTVSASSIEWAASADHEALELTVQNPDGETITETYRGKAVLNLRSLGSGNVDGSYSYELRLIPRVSGSVKQQLAAAREADDAKEVARIMKQYGLNKPVVQSGAFTVLNGAFVLDTAEPDANDEGNSSKLSTNATGSGPGRVQTDDQVIPDDLIVQSSTCTGFDCVDGESFGFDTLRLKENNLRIHFEDTSTSAGFPANDWRIIANDSASGGANKFVIEDSTAARNPVTIEADAPSNALYVDSTGNIGFQQSAPGLDLHLTTTDTPAFRMEQTNAGGFTAQTWDIGANEANFFIRDLTGGSRLSFRIRPGAPTSSVDISADGDVGFSTASPHASTRVDISDSTQNKARLMFTGQEFFQASNTSTDGVAMILGLNRTQNRQLWIADSAALALNSTNRIIRILPSLNGTQSDISAISTDASTPKTLTINSSGGFVGIATSSPTQPLIVGTNTANGNGAHVTTGGVWTNGSSRTFKENIVELSTEEAIKTVSALKPVTYNYKNDPQNEPYVGFIAEDVPVAVSQEYDRRYLSPMDIVATLTKVVQEQQKTIEQLNQRLEQIEKAKEQ